MSEYKNQHGAAFRALLSDSFAHKGFTGCYDGKEHTKVPIKKAGAENYFYTVDLLDQCDPNYIEKECGVIESKAINIIRKIVKEGKLDLTSKEHRDLAEWFVVALIKRKSYIKLTEMLIMENLSYLIPESAFDKFISSHLKNIHEKSSLSNTEFIHQFAVDLLFQSKDALIDDVMSYHWDLLYSKTPFIIGEIPVFLNETNSKVNPFQISSSRFLAICIDRHHMIVVDTETKYMHYRKTLMLKNDKASDYFREQLIKITLEEGYKLFYHPDDKKVLTKILEKLNL